MDIRRIPVRPGRQTSEAVAQFSQRPGVGSSRMGARCGVMASILSSSRRGRASSRCATAASDCSKVGSRYRTTENYAHTRRAFGFASSSTSAKLQATTGEGLSQGRRAPVTRLRQLAPALRRCGWDIALPADGGRDARTITIRSMQGARPPEPAALLPDADKAGGYLC